MSSTETQEVKDFVRFSAIAQLPLFRVTQVSEQGAFYKLLEATAVQVASMHETQAQRDRAQVRVCGSRRSQRLVR